MTKIYVFFIILNALFALYNTQFCGPTSCRVGDCEDTPKSYICHCHEGIQGKNCDRLLNPNDDQCLRNPCWGGGTCLPKSDGFRCICTADRTGNDCKASLFKTETTTKSTSTAKSTTPLICQNGGTVANNKCKCFANYTGTYCEKEVTEAQVKIYNKGWYTAVMSLRFINNGTNYRLKKTLTGGLRHTFKYNIKAQNVTLVIDALLGKNVLNKKLNPTDEPLVCYHVWGSVFSTRSSRMNCW